jgi:hypothetical protein
MNPYKSKVVLYISLIIIVIGAVFLNIRANKKVITEDNTPIKITTPTKEPINESRNLCYYRADKTSSGFYDKAWLKLSILDDKISGEFHNLPAESDSKVGTFEGILEGKLDPKSMSREALVWWNSRAEGMEVKEELMIKWGDGSATAGFGEMVDRGDGVYVYKDKSNLYYIKGMDQKDCEYLDEEIFVEKYIRDNIQTIATNKTALGGTWYVIYATINPATKTGEVIYEDGHIQSKASFTYTYNATLEMVTFPTFEVK